MSRKLALVPFCLALCFAAVSSAQTPDGETPAEETICNLETGVGFALCNAYCEAMDCDSDNPNASDSACEDLEDHYRQARGTPPICTVCDHSGSGHQLPCVVIAEPSDQANCSEVGDLRVLRWDHFIHDVDRIAQTEVYPAMADELCVRLRVDHLSLLDVVASALWQIALGEATHDVIQMSEDIGAIRDEFVDLSALLDFLQNEGGLGPLSQAGQNLCVAEGWAHCVPHFSIAQPIIRDETVLTERADTWEELRDAIVEYNDDPANERDHYFHFTLDPATSDATAVIYALFWSYGGSVTDDEGNITVGDYATTGAAMEMYRDLYLLTAPTTEFLQECLPECAEDPDGLDCDPLTGTDSFDNKAMNPQFTCQGAAVLNPISARFVRDGDGVLCQNYVAQNPGPCPSDHRIDPPLAGPYGDRFWQGTPQVWSILEVLPDADRPLAQEFIKLFMTDYWDVLFAESGSYNLPLFEGQFVDFTEVFKDPELSVFEDSAEWNRLVDPTVLDQAVLSANILEQAFVDYATGAKTLDEAIADLVNNVCHLDGRDPCP